MDGIPTDKKRTKLAHTDKDKAKMKQKIAKAKEESKEIYRQRKCTVESVIGNIKQNLGFREFLLKGLDNVKIEMNLVSIAHNLGKIWRIREGITA